MASPLRRGSKIYFRKAVPKDLVSILGKAEIKISLRTSSVEAARPEFARLNSEWEQRFQSLRQEYKPLTYEDAAAIAGAFYDGIVEPKRRNPDPDGHLQTRHIRESLISGDFKWGRKGPLGDEYVRQIKEERRQEVEAFLAEQGFNYRADDVDLVLKAVNPAAYQAQKRLVGFSEFDFSDDAYRQRFPPLVPPAERIAEAGGGTAEKYDLLKIFDQMSRERDHAASTRSRWRPIVEKIAVEHPDIRTITGEWCVAYKDRLIAAGLTPKTIKEGNLAVLKNLCNYAVDNLRIPTSPMKGVSIRVKARALLRQTKGYNDAEAKVVLKATFAEFSNLLPIDQHAARRWIPWLGYYSGARGGELAQLRKQDFRQEDGICLMHVDPEAGTVKSGEPRDVAIHPHLIDQGLMDFVLNCPRDTLFYDVRRKRVADAKNPPPVKTAENLAKWIRSLGLKDEQLQPNHGWRHRFTTMAREVDMDTVTCRYIQGHAPESEAEKYGNFPAKVLLREISKIPRFELKDVG